MPDVKSSHVIVHRHRQRMFDKHRDKIEAHKKKGPAFAAAIEALENQLQEVSCQPAKRKGRSVATPSMTSSAQE
jgi:hypothetical protein